MTTRFNKIKSNIVCCMITMLCAMPSIMNSDSGLSALLAQTSTNSSNPTLPASMKNSGLSGLLDSHTAASNPVPALVNPQASLLQQFVTVQSNPWYVKAMQILSDTQLKVVYSNSLLSIQLFFMQYTAEDLHKLSATATQAELSLSSLFATALPSSTRKSTDSGVIGLASLLSKAQGVTVQTVSKTAQKKSIASLLSQMNTSVASVTPKTISGLQNLLDVVATSNGNSSTEVSKVTSIDSTSQTNSLSTLLAAQG